MPVDLSGPLQNHITLLRKQAFHHTARGNHALAARAYRTLAKLEREYSDAYLTDSLAKDSWLRAAEEHDSLAVQLSQGVALPQEGGGRGTRQPEAYQSGTRGEEVGLRADIEALIFRSNTTWNDIGGLDEVKEEIKFIFGALFAHKPEGVHLTFWERILLVGPPGTGKSLLAAAVAGSIPGATFFNASLERLTSKYYGESERLIRALFEVAREHAPAVVFLDEIDTLAGRREEGGHEATIRSLNTLLRTVDGIETKDGTPYVLTFAATNRPRVLDPAFVSRFGKQVLVSPPDPRARAQIFKIHMEARGIPVSADYGELARLSEGYTGRDIDNLCRQVVMTILREQNQELGNLIDQGFEKVKQYTLKLRPVTATDVESAKAKVGPSIDQKTIDSYAEWVRKSAS